MAGLNWLGVASGAQAAQGYYDKHLDRERTKKKDARDEERHGLFVRSTEQEMGLRDAREGRAGAKEERDIAAFEQTSQSNKLAYEQAVDERAEWKGQADNRATAAKLGIEGARTQNRLRSAQAGAADARQQLYETQREREGLKWELEKELAPLKKEEARLQQLGDLDGAAAKRLQASQLLARNRTDLLLNIYETATLDVPAAVREVQGLGHGFERVVDIQFEDGSMALIDENGEVVNPGNGIEGEIALSTLETIKQRRAEERISAIEPDKEGRLFDTRVGALVKSTPEERRDEYQAYAQQEEAAGKTPLPESTWLQKTFQSGRVRAAQDAKSATARRARRIGKQKVIRQYGDENKTPDVPEGASSVVFLGKVPHAQFSPDTPLPRWFQVVLVDGKKKLREMP